MIKIGPLGSLPFKVHRKLLNLVRFGTIAWAPYTRVSSFVAYYPDSLRSTQKAASLYRRWIRGNRVNNNGDATRFLGLLLNVQQIVSEGIEGDFAELGVWRGNSAAILAEFAAKQQRKLFLLDTFAGFDSRDLRGHDEKVKPKFSNTSTPYVSDTIGRTEQLRFVPGYFPESVSDELASSTFALVHLDCDLYEPMKAGLEFFYPRLSPGGMLVLHDYSSGFWPGVAAAVDEFARANDEFVTLWPDKSGTAVIRKSRRAR